MTTKNIRLRRSDSSPSKGEGADREPRGDAQRKPNDNSGVSSALAATMNTELPPPAGAPARAPTPAPPPDAPPDDMDFASMLEQAGDFSPMDLRMGDRVTARIIQIGHEDVFFELGPGKDGVMSRAEILDEDGEPTAKEGDEIELFVVGFGGTVTLSKKLGGGAVDIIALEQAQASGIPVEGKVTGVNKGGLEIDLQGARAFCPLGQMDIVRIEEPKELIGRTMTFLVTEVKEGGKDVLVSRRRLLEQERAVAAEKLLEELAVGQVRTGTVTRVTDFGAFVDLGGVDGLVPMGQLSWGQVDKVTDITSVGELVTVEVLRIEDNPKRPGEQRIGLSMRTAGGDPWVEHTKALALGAQLDGRVQRLETYGAFIELFHGVVGLAHISELSPARIRHPSDVVAIGDAVNVRILEVDLEGRRLSLSLNEKIDAADLPGKHEAKHGKVTRIERYGVFVELEGGGTGLLPSAETGTPPGTDLKRAFPLGTELDVMVTDIDERGRIRVSITALEKAEERAVLSEYKSNESDAGFGTFADLFKK